MATLKSRLNIRLAALLVVFGCVFAAFQYGGAWIEHVSQEVKDGRQERKFRKLQEPLNRAKQMIINNQWKIAFDDEWIANAKQLNAETEIVLGIHIRQPYIQFDLRNSALDLYEAYIYMPRGRSLEDYKTHDQFSRHSVVRSLRLDDEWYWILYD